jgi:hypothetical protein
VGRRRVQFMAPSFEEQAARDAAARNRRPLHLRIAPRGKYAEEMERRYREGLPRGVGIRGRAAVRDWVGSLIMLGNPWWWWHAAAA